VSLRRIFFSYLSRFLLRPRMANGLDLAKMRAGEMRQAQTKRTFGCSYEAGELAEVNVRTVHPVEIRSDAVLVYLHGGAYVVGAAQLHWWLLSRLCHDTGSLGVMVDYRLAPEHPFPAALNDAVAVLNDLADVHGANNLVVLGDSAGGGLAVATAMRLRDDGQAVPGKLVLLSPWLDIALDDPDITALEKMDSVLARNGLAEAGKWYASGADLKAPYLSPVRGNLRGLPPMLLQIGTREILLPDCRTFRDKALEQGVDLIYREYPELFHVWTLLFPMLPEGEEAVQEILAFVC
jgi:acetyl esterase/lipase